MTAAPVMLNVMSDDEVARFGRDPEAGFGALQTERGQLPLVAMDVDVRVVGIVASIEVAQTFVNTTRVAIEATYMFPLPDRAAVHRFRMEVAGRVVEGVIDERGAAREAYDDALAAGHRAAITEQERAGVFTLRVGNLMPGESATVRLTLVGPLSVDDGEVTFRFPLVVAPRFMAGDPLGGDQAGLGTAADTTLVPDASRISPPVLLPGCPNPVRLGVRVALEDRRVQGVSSSLHAVTTMQRDAQIVEIRPGERLDRDFILRWRIDGAELRTSLMCADDPDGRHGTFLLTLVPPSTSAAAAKPRDVVFVIDRSGSMAGWKMVAARRAAARMIDTLTSRDRFCAIAFDNTMEMLPEGALVDATDRNRFRAVEALAKVDSRGGTELAEPLREAAQMLAGGHDDRERVIVLVTDGQVGNEDHILHELTPRLKNVRMFTLGIDQAVNAAFLKRLAAAGGGLCELVESEDRLDAVMAKVHRRIGTPIATELVVRGAGLELVGSEMSPSRLPDVYAGAAVTIFGRYRGSATAGGGVEITGTSLGEALRVSVTGVEERRPTSWLAASWARALIRDLEDQYAAGVRDDCEHRIVALSKDYGVLSRFTAFLAVDRSEVVNRGGRIHQAVQAVEPPAGWTEAAKKKSARPREEHRSSAPSFSPSGAPPPAPPQTPMPIRATASAQAPRSVGREAISMGRAPSPADASAPRGAPPAPWERAPVVNAGPKKAEARADIADDAPLGMEAYLVQLATLARELEGHARAHAGAAAIRLVRQRLTEWIEDVRSVGANDALATTVELAVQRLTESLRTGAFEAVAVIVAGELAALAGGAPPPANKPSRVAFWK